MTRVTISKRDHELLRSEFDAGEKAELKSIFVQFEAYEKVVELDMNYVRDLLLMLDSESHLSLSVSVEDGVS